MDSKLNQLSALEQSKIFDCELEDLEALCEIENSAHVSPWSVELIAQSLSGNNLCRKLVDDNEICGFYILLDNSEAIEVLDIVVRPVHQSKGVGNKLLLSILTTAKQLKRKEVLLEVRRSNDKAIMLYKKCGFSQVGIRKNYYPILSHANIESSNGATFKSVDREDAIVMSCKVVSD